MECWMSNKEIKQKRINKQIEKQLKKDYRDPRRHPTILLFGPSESGKSTFLKQMRIIHGSGYSYEDKQGLVKLVYQNIFMAMQSMINAMDILKIEYGIPGNEEKAKLISNIDRNTVTSFESPYPEAFKSLWADTGIQECYDRRRIYNLTDSAKYYLSDLERIKKPGYLPTEQDILRARDPAKGSKEYIFNIDSRIYTMLYPGRYSSHRRRWIYSMENITSMIFVVALSEYDQNLYEFSNKNRMEESIMMFKAVLTYPFFQNTSIILFLNKKDLLEEKIMVSHLVDYFPEYTGPKLDSVSAREYIREIYLKQNLDPDRSCFSHFTTATDMGDIRRTFCAVKDTILQCALKEFKLT